MVAWRPSGTALTLRVRPNGAIESMTPLFPFFSLLRKHAPYGRLAALRDRSHPPGSPQYHLQNKRSQFGASCFVAGKDYTFL